MKAVPVVMVSIHMSRKPQPGFGTMTVPLNAAGFSSHNAMKKVCRILRMIVP
ncbi:MAG: hypothetical protein BWY49_01275 [Candidatus Omnitrophica bacterium ADurb.Bin314]|nr:MAG: hypothetical protein BWY49_01275 [Candidatus Omnitrophica bacterium ADurb.Bin314]